MAKKNILVVDDNATIASIVREALKNEGYSVTCAHSGEEALDHLDGQTVDLIILDVLMPQMDGFEVLRRVKASPKTISIPVIMLTVNDKHDDVLEAYKLGAECYITKPFRPRELIHNVQLVLGRDKDAVRKPAPTEGRNP
jgi:DNA-binding response OmpR family regulator